MKKIGKRALALALVVVIALLNIPNYIRYAANNSADDEPSIVKMFDASKYSFNPTDVLVWAAYVGTHTEVKAGEGIDSSIFPFIATEIKQESLDNNDVIPLTADSDISDNWINANEATLLLRSVFHGSEVWGIRESISKKLNINKDDVDVDIIVNLPETNEKAVYSHAGDTEKSMSEKLEVVRKVYDYCKECSTSGKYKELEKSNRYQSMICDKEKWESTYQKLYNEIDVSDMKTEEEKNQKRELEAKTAMITGNPYKDETVKGRHNFYTVTYEAKLKDGSVYRMIVGKNKVNGNDYRLAWLMERVKQPEKITITEKTPWSTKLNYVSYPEGKLSEDGTYMAPYYDNDNNEKDVDVTAMIRSNTEETIVATHSEDALPADGSNNAHSWSYTYTPAKLEIKKTYRFDDYDNITANGMVKENVPLKGGEGGESSQNPSIKWTFRRKNIEKVENSDGSITITILFNLPINVNAIPEGWSAIFDDNEKTTSHRITRTFRYGEEYDKDVEVEQNETKIKIITHITIVIKRTTPAKWETALNYVSYPEGKKSADDTYLAPYYYNDINETDVDITAMIRSLTDEMIVATHDNDALPADGNLNKNEWNYTYALNKLEIKKIYRFAAYDNIVYNGIVKEAVPLTGSNGSVSKQNVSIRWTFRRKNIEKVVNSDGSTTVTIIYNLPIDINSIPEGWTAVFDDNEKTTSHKITRTFSKEESYDKDVIVKQNGTTSQVVTHIKIVVEVVPDNKPETKPDPTPDTNPEPNPEKGPEPTPDTNPEPNPEKGPEPTPDTNPEPNPEKGPEPTPDTNPEPTPEKVPETTPETKPEPTPEKVPETSSTKQTETVKIEETKYEVIKEASSPVRIPKTGQNVSLFAVVIVLFGFALSRLIKLIRTK